MQLRIRTRLTLITAVLVAIVLTATGLFLVVRLRADLLAGMDAGLRVRADTLARTLGPDGTLAGGAGRLDPEDAFAQVLDVGGHVVDTSPGFPTDPLLTPAEVTTAGTAARFKTMEVALEERLPARILAVPAVADRVLVVGASLEEQRDAIARLTRLLAVSGPLVLALVTAVGWWVAGAALRPIDAMRREAAAMSASEPDRRLPVPATGDEISRLADTLNEMLGRLHSALDRERRFVADAGHELRTPLANLTAELDLGLRRRRSADELRQALQSAAEETERLTDLAEDLLVLARAGNGHLPVLPEPLSVPTLVAESVNAFAARAADRQITIQTRVSNGLSAGADPRRLRQALENVLDNALRHTPAGGQVTVTASRSDRMLTIEVADTGEGFPEPFLAHAFEPFSRADAARSREAGGAGLGLAIARTIAQAHGGDASASNSEGGGAVVALRIPQ